VSFSPNGAFLASSDLSGKMCIWDPSTGELLHFYTAGTSILSLLWADSDTIICGLADGTIAKLCIGDEEVSVQGKWCHSHPVEHLALSGSLLASGAHSEVFVWDMSQHESLLSLEKEVDSPIATSGEEIIVTGLHWGTHRTHRRASSILLVTFMSHGIYVYDTRDWSILQQFGNCDSGFMASSSLSPDALHIAVANLVNGFDVYNLDMGSIVLSLFHKVGKGYPVPVLYVHGGNAILGGSTAGVLDLWYVE
ncbi:WD40 repeat-like protein, partial [Cubamyces sp. BRFM 1775]